jgi:hypothetical protein
LVTQVIQVKHTAIQNARGQPDSQISHHHISVLDLVTLNRVAQRVVVFVAVFVVVFVAVPVTAPSAAEWLTSTLVLWMKMTTKLPHSYHTPTTKNAATMMAARDVNWVGNSSSGSIF